MAKRFNYIPGIVVLFFLLLVIGTITKREVELYNYKSNSQPYYIEVKIDNPSDIVATLNRIEVSNSGIAPKIINRTGNVYQIEVKCPPENIGLIRNLFKN